MTRPAARRGKTQGKRKIPRKKKQISEEAQQIAVEQELQTTMENKSVGNGLEHHQGRFDEAVGLFIEIRDEIRRRDEAHELELKKLKHQKLQMEGVIREILESNGQEAARSKHGTAYLSERTTASLTEPDTYMAFVIENKLFDLIERRAAAIPVQDYVRQHGELPPGCKLSTIQTVGVRKS